jgi:hypothetical protein
MWSDTLRDEMWEETRLFFADLMRRDASPLEIVTGTRTFANDEIAAIYGVSGVSGAGLQAIDTDPKQRAGVLTMPAVLAMTSGLLRCAGRGWAAAGTGARRRGR